MTLQTIASAVVPAQVWNLWSACTEKAGKADKELGRYAVLDMTLAAAGAGALYFAQDKCEAFLAVASLVAAVAAKFSGSASLMAGSAIAFKGFSGAYSVGFADKLSLAGKFAMGLAGVVSMSAWGAKKFNEAYSTVASYLPPQPQKVIKGGVPNIVS